MNPQKQDLSDTEGRKYILALDGAYYSEAINRRDAAAQDEKSYDDWATRITTAQDQISEIESHYKDPGFETSE